MNPKGPPTGTPTGVLNPTGHRRGPRPLLLHLTLAMLKSSVSVASSSTWNPGWPNSNAQALLLALAQGGRRDAFPHAVLHEALAQDHALIAGILAYRRHPWRRDMPAAPILWQDGGSTLRDHGGSGPVVLVVPSLVNRADVLDLTPTHSMLRWLAANGVHPVLLDWGEPGPEERGFTLDDYVARRLDQAIAALGTRVVMAGYCMGGLLATAAALRNPGRVRGLGLLATPWDFHAPDPDRARLAAGCLPLLEPFMALDGVLPVDALQSLFALLDPWGVAVKYRAFARMPPDSDRAALFVAIEDWLNDGVPLAEAVARSCLGGWYGGNDTMRLDWRIDGSVVDPARIAMPAWVAIPARDRIVPPESATALAAAIPHAVRHAPAAGHVGMVAGLRAEATLWRPLRDWVLALPRRQA